MFSDYDENVYGAFGVFYITLYDMWLHVTNRPIYIYSYPYYQFSRVCQCVCHCATFDKFLPVRSHFDSKRPENCVA